MKRWWFVFPLLVVLSLCACGKNTRYQADFTDLFDTHARFITYAPDDTTFTAAFDTAYDELLRLHRYYDIYHEYEGINNLKTVNDNAGVAPVPVAEEIISLLVLAKEAYYFTEHSVNVALGPVTLLWKNAGESPPTEDALLAAASLTDIKKLIIDTENGTVFLSESGMRLDVGAIAKGYAAQRVIETLSRQGVTSCLLDMGGNVVAMGKPGDGASDPEYWRVGIQNPFGVGYLNTLRVRDVAMVTSGDYQRGTHIIDPVTLSPVNRFRAVTVTYENSGLADILSTALYILPYEKGRALADAYGAAALWVLPDESIITNEYYNALLLSSSIN